MTDFQLLNKLQKEEDGALSCARQAAGLWSAWAPGEGGGHADIDLNLNQKIAGGKKRNGGANNK